ncbi:methylmalonyl-CoA mutase subunit beta [Algibacter sp. PT7-4]|uniref:methylmalonyl-CoA mutase subunit beta n=1 Tax=Algibacter ulvanivorans TaxID=3400999 RepID=UPI003AAC8C18
MNNNLFDEFNPVSTQQWKQKIQFDLKGANYNDALIWKSNEGINIKPFYNSDDVIETSNTSNTKASQWKICQTIFVSNVEKSNTKALEAINKGTESIKFIIPSENTSIEKLTQNINISTTQLYFETQFLSEKFIQKIHKQIPNAKTLTDTIGQLAKTGNWYSSLKNDMLRFEAAIKTSSYFSVNTSLYQNAGANITQQLAYALAHANEYLNTLENSGNNLQSINAIFNISVGTNYFFEIAKLKALRLLWNTLATQYSANSNCHIIATPTKRNKTLYDYNTNMLRTTTECMSAILGGANTINNLPYDSIYHKNNEFGERIARNQLLVLKHESYFDKVNNPSDGSYYIESLTQQLSENALELFKNIENNGGFLNQLKQGTIQRKIKESALKEQQQFNSGEKVLLGTNKHPNANDKMKNELERYPFVKTNPRKTLIEPIIEHRLSEQSEQNRLQNEN